MSIEIPQTEKELFKYLNKKDRELLSKHYGFYRSLETGTRKPENEDQRRFVDVCQGIVTPHTDHEKAYLRHIRNRKIIKPTIKRSANETAQDVVKQLKNGLEDSNRRREEESKKKWLREMGLHDLENLASLNQGTNKPIIFEKYEVDIDKIQAQKRLKRARLRDLYSKKVPSESQNGIPEYEDGAPRGNDGISGSREDCKKMRNWRLS